MPPGMPAGGGEGGPGAMPGVGEAPMGAEEQYSVLRLKHCAAKELAQSLSQLFSDRGAKIVADSTSNSLIIVRAGKRELEMIQQLVTELDQPAAGGRPGK